MAKKTETRPATATINPFGLRMQQDLRDRLEAAASESGRSLNAEIAARLEESFRPNLAKEGFDALLKSQLLNFELAAQLSKYDIRKFQIAGALFRQLFEPGSPVSGAVEKLAIDGDPVATKATATADAMLELATEVQKKARAIVDDGKDPAEAESPEVAAKGKRGARKPPKSR